MTTRKLNENGVIEDYSQMGLSDEQSNEIFQGLENSHTTILKFLGNHAGYHAMSALVQAIEKNKHLSKIYLGDNEIGDDSAHLLAKTLGANDTVTVLDLNSNQITDSGATSLAQALAENKTLTDLDLSNNLIKDVGFKHVLSALKNNKQSALTSLESFQNLTTDTSITDEIDECCNNNKLKRL